MGSCKDDLGEYDEPVVFNDATADALDAAASSLSSTISTMGTDVGVWASTASADFEGHYGDVFDSGAKAGQEDCFPYKELRNNLAWRQGGPGGLYEYLNRSG